MSATVPPEGPTPAPVPGQATADVGQRDLFCPNCGYNLRGLVMPPPAAPPAPGAAARERPCPECGQPFNPATLATSINPWTHRQKIGRVRAFVRTVFLATFKPKRLAQDINYDVSYRDAQKFRFIVILINFVPLCLAVAGLYGYSLITHRGWNLSWFASPREFAIEWGDDFLIPVLAYIPEPWPAIVGLLSAFLVLLVVTGFHTYFFHPRSLPLAQQNRAVALGYYGCAPVGLLMPVVLVVVLLRLGMHVLGMDTDEWIMPVVLFALVVGVSLGVILYRMWRVPWILLKQTTHCSTGRVVNVGVLTPLAVLVLGVLAFLGPAALAIYVATIYDSLH